MGIRDFFIYWESETMCGSEVRKVDFRKTSPDNVAALIQFDMKNIHNVDPGKIIIKYIRELPY